MTTNDTEARQQAQAAEPLALRSDDQLGLAERLRTLWPAGVTQCKWCGGFGRPPCGCPADEAIERLRAELALCCELKREYQERAAERERCAIAGGAAADAGMNGAGVAAAIRRA